MLPWFEETHKKEACHSRPLQGLASDQILHPAKDREIQASLRIQTPAHLLSAAPSSLCSEQECYICWEPSSIAYKKVLPATCLLGGWAKIKEHIVIDLEAHGPTEYYPGKRDQPLSKEMLPIW